MNLKTRILAWVLCFLMVLSQSGFSETEAERILVAYFSATGTTRSVAEKMATLLGADLYEIVPFEPYSAEDLNYHEDACRANREQSDRSLRPEIVEDDLNPEAYDVLLIGHPIWWGEEPRILDSFMDTYDFSGKTLANFCTSGGSDIATATERLKKLSPQSNWLTGNRFSSKADEEEIAEWLINIGLYQ